MVGFDEGKGDVGGPEFDRNPGEAGAGAEVGKADSGASLRWTAPSAPLRAGLGGCPDMSGDGEQMTGGEEGFAEVAGDYFFWIADGGEVDAGVPAEEYIDVRRYMFVECVVGREPLVVGILQERLEQFGDAGGVHVESDCRQHRLSGARGRRTSKQDETIS